MKSFACHFSSQCRNCGPGDGSQRLAGGSPYLTAMMAWTCLIAGSTHLMADGKEDSPWWPHFHGPQRDNISRETDLMTTWPEEGPKLLWRASNCGMGYSGVSIADGMVFTAGDFDDVEKVLALDMKGRPLWQSPNGASWVGSYPGSRTTPAYSDGMVYQMNPKGRLAAFQAQSGNEVWVVDLVKRYGARYGTWSMTENVVIEGDLLYCVPGGKEALVVALNKKTGKTVWTTRPSAPTARPRRSDLLLAQTMVV